MTETRLGWQRAVATLGLACLASCAAPVSVKPVVPVPPGAGSGAVLKGAPEPSLASVLGDVHEAWKGVGAGEAGAVGRYNYGVARLVEAFGEPESGGLWSGPVAVPGGRWTLRGQVPVGFDTGRNHLIPVDTLSFSGEFSEHDAVVEGLGAPVVASEGFEGMGHQRARRHLPVRNLTALVRFDGDSAVLELADPYQVESVRVAGRRSLLAADFGAALMLGLSKTRVDKLGLVRLLRPSSYDDTIQLNFTQPYDPDRIPVLFVHGLDSTAATWVPMYFELLKDPLIRENYQFWVFSYPSGYPYPYSAHLLREELDEVARGFPDRRELVIVGHSMGGVIGRLMVVDAGETIWRKAFGKPPDETPMRGKSRDLLESSVVFNHRPEIDRAVFISSPHRGSELAARPLGRLGSRLVKLPSTMADLRDTMVSAATADASRRALGRAPNSIDTLSPDNFFVVEAAKLPIVEGMPYHVIVGDRGKGDTPDSSDGVVPYWSSHLDGSDSEKIVPSGHGAHRHPVGIEEVRRILRLHLEELE